MTKPKRDVFNRFIRCSVAIYQKALNYNNKKRKHCLRTVWNAILYLIKTGCQWRMLPKNFPNWQLVYYYFKKWADLEEFDALLEKIRGKVRLQKGQNFSPSLGIEIYKCRPISNSINKKHI
ncbi:transposase [Emticicia sp. 17c]|uniref:transposase n=1 Tax=Emticicia sp. 17c TaxID=3127704 RepID=UPI00301D9A9B